MMSLTARQTELYRFLVREQSEGRRISLCKIGAALGCNKTNASELRARLHLRISKKDLDLVVPRGPSGERLRFIPLAALPSQDGVR